MKKKFAALVMALAMAFSFAACSDDDGGSSAPETVTVTETAEPTPEPLEPPSLDTPAPPPPSDTYDPLRPPELETPGDKNSLPGSQTPNEKLFLEVLYDNTTEFKGAGDELVLDLAHEVCNAWDGGLGFNEIADIILGVGYSPADGGFLIGAATQAFCPKYVSQIG